MAFAASCFAYGDPHYMTFDGVSYNFMGSCNYVLTQERLVEPPTFRILVENMPCGSTGMSCTKAVSVEVRGLRVQLVRGANYIIGNQTMSMNKVERYFGSDLTICESGIVTQLTFHSIGLVVIWDGCEYSFFINSSVNYSIIIIA